MIKKCKTCGEVAEMRSLEIECSSCSDKRYYRILKEQIEIGKVTETKGQHKVVCPYCGEVQEYDIYTEGTRQIQCHDCLNCFELTVRASYYYDTQRINHA